MKMRSEHDSLGQVKVPDQALYGAQTTRALHNFQISGRTSQTALIRAYLQIKVAAARANKDCEVLTPEIANWIERAVDELLRMPQTKWPEIFAIDIFQAGAGTSLNMNVNEVIANLANCIAGSALGTYHPVHPNDHVNHSQSTNDTFPTAMRLALLEVSAPLETELEDLAKSFQTKAEKWREIPKSARTHLQDAVPIRLGQEFAAYGVTILRCAQWIQQARNELRELGIGGSAAGSGLNVPKGYTHRVIEELSELTKEDLWPAPNLYEAMQSQSPVFYYSSMLRLLALEVTRICNDLRLMASGPMTGFAEIRLPAVQPGSSIMPGKVNPSILEAVNQTMFAVLGHDQTSAFALQAGQLELNVMMPVMANSLLEASHISTHAMRTLREKCIDGLEANEEKLRHHFESTPQVATALSPRLGYEKTAQLVQESLATGHSVIALVRKKQLMSEAELAQILDLRSLTGS